MKVLVTGANGFLGQQVIKALLKMGHEPRALTRREPTTFSESGVEWTQGDLVHDDLASAVSGCDAVIHLAAQMTGSDVEQQAVAVEGTRRLLAEMSRQHVARLIHASSFSIYDWSRIRRSIHENSPILAESTRDAGGYAIAKLSQERIVNEWSSRTEANVTMLRPAALWDQTHLPSFTIGPAIGPLLLVIAPTRRLHLMHVANCASAFVQSLTTANASHSTINLCDSERVTAWQFAALVARSDRKWRVPIPYVVGRSAASVASAFRRLFGERFRVPSLLLSRQYVARFRATACSNDRMKRTFGWYARSYFDHTLQSNQQSLKDLGR